MKLFNGHINLNAKSVSGAVGGILTMAAAFHWLTSEQAAAVTGCIAAVLAALVPDREATK